MRSGRWTFSLGTFSFIGRRRDRCKIIFWDRGGLVIYFKRLEKGAFRLPKRTADGKSIEMDATELAMLLDGLDFGGVKKAARWNPLARRTG